MSKLHKHVLVEVSLVGSSSSSVRTTTVSVRSISKAERDWLVEHKVWHIVDRYFKWFDLYAYPCFYCCNYFAADVRTHILADHINNQPFKITIMSLLLMMICC
jgi:hypothetical protein